MENPSFQPNSEDASIISFIMHRDNDNDNDNEEINITVSKAKQNYYKYIIYSFVIILILILCITFCIIGISRKQSYCKSTSNTTNSKKKVLLIIADGIAADVIENATTPNLNRIKQNGTYKRAFIGGEYGTLTETPTISAPGYMTIITGTWSNKHNVKDNNASSPNYHYKNIFRLLKEHDCQHTIGIFSSWIINRLTLIGEGLSAAGNIEFDYKFDGYDLDTRTYPHDPLFDHIRQIDERVVDETVKCFEKTSPDLSWLYLDYTDEIGHLFGDSPQLYESISNLDRNIGRIYDVIERRIRSYGEEWLIIMTTDHGRDPFIGKKHGQQSERERTTWILTNYNQTNRYFQEFRPAAVDILPTIARFLDLNISKEIVRELDGVPLIGNISLIQPEISLSNNTLVIQWKALDNRGNVTVWLSTTNRFSVGSKDNYQFICSVPIENQRAQFNIKDYPILSQFHTIKITLEGQFNSVNKWF